MFITNQNVSFFHCFPYNEEGRGIFLWKNEYYMGPLFSKFIFPKSCCASAHQFWARSVHPFSRKMTFLFKIDHFQQSKLSQLSRDWRVWAFTGRCQSIRHTLYYRKVLFSWFHFIYFLKNDQFFPEKWQEIVSKNVHFLVNCVTFVIHSYS